MAVPHVRLTLLGASRVEIEGRHVAFHNRRAIAVLAWLAVERRQRERSVLASMLWEGSAPSTALGNLRVVLSDIRRKVPGLLEIGRSDVRWLGGTHVSVDVDEVRAAAASERASSAQWRHRVDAMRRIVDLCAGEFMPGAERLGGTDFATWVELERSELQRQCIEVGHRLTSMLIEDGETGEAATVAARVLRLDPYREASHLALIRALTAGGRHEEASAQLDRCRSILVADLGVELGPELRELAAALGPARAPSSRRSLGSGSLPQRRMLIGREAVMGRVTSMMRPAALVSLVGPAGIGKTALANELGHRWLAAGDDVQFVDASGRDLTGLVGAIASAVGVTVDLGGDVVGAIDLIAEVVAGRPTRLIVDDLEPAGGCSQALGRLAERCPDVGVLVTSRLPLGLDREYVVVVPPLELPSDDHAQHAAECSAVRLFVEQARRAGAEPVDDPNLVGRLCRMLDGLPLAIELIAARRRLLDLHSILEMVESGAGGVDLVGSDRTRTDRPEHHRGLRAALLSNVELLDADARQVFATFGAFDGPVLMSEIAAVVPGIDVVGAIDALRTLRLVRIQASGSAGRAVRSLDRPPSRPPAPVARSPHTGGEWCDMLPYVRTIAREALAESGRADAVKHAVVEHDVALALRATVPGPAMEERFAELDHYWPTLRATLDALHEWGDPREAAVLVALAPFLLTSARIAEGARLFARAQVPKESALDAPWLGAEVRLWSAAFRAETIGFRGETVDDVLGALDSVRRAGAPAEVQLRSIVIAEHVADLAGRHEVAARLVADGRALALRARQPWYGVELLHADAMLAHLAGDEDRASAVFRTVLGEAELHGHRRMATYARMMSELTGASGTPGGAPHALASMLATAVELGDRRQTVWLLVSLGAVAVLDGEVADAAEHFDEAAARSLAAGYHVGIGFALMGGAAIGVVMDDLAAAMTFHGAVEESLEQLARSMPRRYVDAYRALVLPSIEDAQHRDPGLVQHRERGRWEERRETVGRLRRYLAGVRAGATGASPLRPTG